MQKKRDEAEMDDFYGEFDDYLEDDEISAQEAAFMEGYILEQ